MTVCTTVPQNKAIVPVVSKEKKLFEIMSLFLFYQLVEPIDSNIQGTCCSSICL